MPKTTSAPHSFIPFNTVFSTKYPKMKRSQLPRSPLILVIAQVQFSPVEGVRKYIRDIQEELRMKGFPYFEMCPIQQVTMMGPSLQVSTTDQWFFTDKSKQTNIVLTKNALVVNTVKYTTFDEYLPKVGEAVEVISQKLKLAQFGALERVSLRYVDQIRQLDGVTPEKMVKDEYLGGFLNDSDVVLRQVVIERRTKAGGGIRTILFRPNNPNAVFGEFQAVRLNLPQFLQGEKPLILDMEHSMPVQGKDFLLDNILSIFRHLHGELDDLFFEKIPTEVALTLWGKEGE